MASLPSARQALERDFLDMRARLIDLAAALDRIGRAGGSAEGDPRMDQMRRALEILGRESNDRAEQIQLLFSLPYEPDWRKSK